MLAWLDALKQHGIQVKAILFDGALPNWKSNIRLERMKKLAVKLTECRDNISEDDDRVPHKADNDDELINIRLLLQSSTSPSSNASNNHGSETHISAEKLAFHNHRSRVTSSSTSMDFPAPCFLVASMLECLRKNEHYAQLTHMVPGEADSYCAGYAHELGSAKETKSVIVVTSDSDLLAYDLGTKGRVMLFRDMDVNEAEGDASRTLLNLRLYATNDIAQRHGLNTLLPLAFSVHVDRFRSFGTHLVEAKKEENRPSQSYRDFCKEYESRQLILEPIGDTRLFRVLQELDTKTSELVHQFLQHKGLAHRQDALKVYLPAGHEDAHRASMWVQGREIRQITYTLLISSQPARVSTVVEHYRKGNRIGETEVDVMKHDDLIHAIKRTSKSLEASFKLLTTSASAPSWRELGLLWLSESLVSGDKSVPSRQTLMDIYRGGIFRSWATLHLYAQYQAILDSWRMLKQCIRLHVALENESKGQLLADIKHLLQCLEQIPGSRVSEMFDPLVSRKLDHDRVKSIIDHIYDELAVTEDAAETKKSRKRKSKQKDGHVGNKAKKIIPSRTGGNMFDLLASMEGD